MDEEDFTSGEEASVAETPIDVPPDVTPTPVPDDTVPESEDTTPADPPLNRIVEGSAYDAKAVARDLIQGGTNRALEGSGNRTGQQRAESRASDRRITALAAEVAYTAAYNNAFSSIGQKAEKASKVEKTKLASMKKDEALMRAQILAMQDVYNAQLAYASAQKHYAEVLVEGEALKERHEASRDSNIKEFSQDLAGLQKVLEEAPLKAKEALDAAKETYFTIDDRQQASQGAFAHEYERDPDKSGYVYLIYQDGDKFYQVYADDLSLDGKASYDIKHPEITEKDNPTQFAAAKAHAEAIKTYKDAIAAGKDPGGSPPKEFISKEAATEIIEAKAIAQKEYTEHMYKMVQDRFHKSGLEQQVIQFQQKIEEARKAVEDCKKQLDEKLAYAQSLGADLDGKNPDQVAQDIFKKQQELKTLQEDLIKQEYTVSQYEAIIAYVKSPQMKEKLNAFIKNGGIANYKDIDEIPGLTDDNYKAGIVADLERNNIKVENVPPHVRDIAEGIKKQKAEAEAQISAPPPKPAPNSSVADAVDGRAPLAKNISPNFASASAAPAPDTIQPAQPAPDNTRTAAYNTLAT